METQQRRTIRSMAWTYGTLVNKAGSPAQVRFSLTETQQLEGGIPTTKTAEGTIEFSNSAAAYRMLTTPDIKTLKGGGMTAEVTLTSEDTFSVIGEVGRA